MMNRILFTFIFSYFITSVSMCQIFDSEDTIIANNYYAVGDTLLKQSKHEHSIIKFRAAALIYQNSNLWQKYFQSLNMIGVNLWQSGDYEAATEQSNKILLTIKEKLGERNIEEANAYNSLGSVKYYEGDYKLALTYFLKNMEIKKEIYNANHPEMAQPYNALGVIHDATGAYDSALVYYKKVLKVSEENPESPSVAGCYNNMAIVYKTQGFYEIAMEYYRKSLALNIKNYGDSHPRIGGIYNGMGNVLTHLGAFTSAIEYYKKDLTINQTAFGELHINVANSYSNIGVAYFHSKKYEMALPYHKRALAIYQRIIDSENLYVAGSYANMADVFYELKEFEKGIDFNTKSLSMHKRIVGENHLFVGQNYYSLGIGHQRLERFEKSFEYLNKALKVFQENYGVKHPKIASTFNLIAETQLIVQDSEQALFNYESAMDANILGLENPSNILTNSSSTDYLDLMVLLESYKGKALVFDMRFHQKGELQDLNLSLNNFQICDSLISRISQNYLNQNDIVNLGRIASEIYEKSVNVCGRLSQLTKEAKYNELAFYFSERKRARVLKQTILGAFAEESGEIPIHLLSLEKKIKIGLAFFRSQIKNEKAHYQEHYDTVRVARWEAMVFDLKRRNDSLIMVLKKNYTNYFSLKYEDETITPKEIQQKLADNTALIEYFEADSIIYAFYFDVNIFKVIEINKTSSFNLSLEDHVEKMNKPGEYNYSKSYELYEHLINPLNIDPTIKNIIIVPEGSLWNVNFDLLPRQEGRCEEQMQELCSYMMNDYNISYGYSTYILMNQHTKAKKVNSKLLAFSYGEKDASNLNGFTALHSLRNLSDKLPGSSSEISAISEFVEGSYFYGKGASESKFKLEASRYSIIHLAVHGETNENKPSESKLMFSTKGDSIEDGNLHAFELYSMSLNADLAVLSACNSGTGKIETGEGLMSMGRAFSYAGVSSLVLNRWEVSDITAPYIMKYFYEGLYQGMRKSEALSYAKRRFLISEADNVTSAPFYWAGFYVLGDDSPIVKKTDWNVRLIWLVAILLIIGALGYFKNREVSD